MKNMGDNISIGFLTIHAEASERRAFLPNFVANLERMGAQVVLEHGYGSGLGLSAEDYCRISPEVVFASREEVYQQDCVLVIRYPGDDEIALMHPSGCLISMLHYPTRPKRAAFLHSLGIEAISLDSLKDDTGRRLVENLRSVAWNGVEAAFRTLRTLYPSPGFDNPRRPPIHVLLVGAGAIGSHVMQAAIRYGNLKLWNDMTVRNVPGVQVTAIDYDTTSIPNIMLELMHRTDLLVDATQRSDSSKPVIHNEWIGVMPSHAVLLDLSVDPYDCTGEAPLVKGIEGIPQGNLDQYIIAPDDPLYDSIPECIPTAQRRYCVSCYSWPGIYPRECMELYAHQIHPIMRLLIEKGGVANVHSRGRYFERAISRALLSNWIKNGNDHRNNP
jgi:alanine dehydrogenase